MAKHYRLIPDESNNWEVAAFLLIDHLYMPNAHRPNVRFSRIDLHSPIKSLDFIEKLLGPIGYVVNKTLNNSISSAITRLEDNGYLKCDDGECILTNEGFNRSQEIKAKYKKGNLVPIGKTKEAFNSLSGLSENDLKDLIEKVKKNINGSKGIKY